MSLSIFVVAILGVIGYAYYRWQKRQLVSDSELHARNKLSNK